MDGLCPTLHLAACRKTFHTLQHSLQLPNRRQHRILPATAYSETPGTLGPGVTAVCPGTHKVCMSSTLPPRSACEGRMLMEETPGGEMEALPLIKGRSGFTEPVTATSAGLERNTLSRVKCVLGCAPILISKGTSCSSWLMDLTPA